MSRWPVLLSFVACLFVAETLSVCGATTVDVARNKETTVQFGNNDVVPKTQVRTTGADARGLGFIGDVALGARYPDETVFRRIIDFNNPTNVIQSSSAVLHVDNGLINYVSVSNNLNSRAVACVDTSGFGTSRITINLRFPPNTKSQLSLELAAH